MFVFSWEALYTHFKFLQSGHDTFDLEGQSVYNSFLDLEFENIQYMHTLKRQAIVPYSARQMFELVNHIEDYPRFLPWCHSSKIISRTEEEVVAELEVVWKGIHKQFTTRNKLFPYSKMDIHLVNGPLQQMDGLWAFDALNDKACKVSLDMTFTFSGSWVDRLFQPIFQHIANTLVDAFCKRAVELYNK